MKQAGNGLSDSGVRHPAKRGQRPIAFIVLGLIIATRNEHKVGEISSILGNDFRYLTLKDFPAAPLTVEDAKTFAGNATKKAVELAKSIAGWQPLAGKAHRGTGLS